MTASARLGLALGLLALVLGSSVTLVTAQQPTYTPDEIDNLNKFGDAIGWIQTVLLILSIVGCFLTVLTFVAFPAIRTYPIKLICWLSVSIALGQLLFLLIQTYAGVNLVACTIGGAAIHYFFLTNFFWCFCLAFNFYQLIVKRNSQTRALEKYYHFVGWGIPFIFVILLGALQQYGRIGAAPNYGCYIRSGDWVLIGFFIPGVLMVAANAVLFFFVASEIHGTLSKAPETEQKQRRENSKEMRVLISIFVTVGLSWIFGFFISLTATVFVLYQIVQILFTVTAPLQGFFIFVAYCINKKVINRWKSCFGCHVDETDQTSATASSRGGSGTSATRSAASQSGRVD